MKNAQRNSKRRMVLRLLTTAVSAAAVLDQFAERAAAVTVTASWSDGSIGAYAQPAAWSPAGAPADSGMTFYDVIINRPGGAAVEGNLSAEILNLTIGADNSLSFDPGIQFMIAGQPGGGFATVSNDGLISLGSSSLSSQMRITFKGGQANLTGAGAVLMGGPFCQITSNSFTQLTTSNFIHGVGNLGSNTMSIINNGSIVADSSAGSLVVGLSNPGLTNNGSLSATGGGTLALSGSTVTNMGTGTILADTGSNVEVLSATISGGTLAANGTGAYLIVGSSGLSGLTNNATVNFADNATLTLSGTIVNNGIIAANGTGASTISVNGSTVTLNGTGTLQLGTSGTGTTTMIGAGPLVNNSNIVGHGSIAFTVVRNSGLIASNAGTGSLSISGSLSSPAVVNSGTIRAASGTMNLGFGTWDNTGGTLDVVSGNRMTFGTGSNVVSLAITGGSLNVANGGTVDTVAGSGNTTLTSMAINNSGIINVNPGTSLTTVNDTYNGNNFVQLLGNSTNSATLTINGATTTFSGLAGIGMSPGFTSTIAINGNGIFDNRTFVSGGGLIGQNTLTIFNSGTITVGGTVFVTLDPGPGGLTNTGTLQATIGTLVFANGSYTNNGGTITAQLGGTVLLSDGAIITGGKYASGTNGGQIKTDVLSAVQISNGTITNVGMTVVGTSSLTIDGTITNNGSLNVTAGAAAAKLLLGNTSVTLSGTGTTTLSTTGAGTALIDGSGGTLNIGSQQLVHGAGVIGSASLAINNSGTISADIGNQTLTISASNLTNNGLLGAAGGGILSILNGSGVAGYANNGTIQTSSNGVVVLGDAVKINGGTFEGLAGSGTINIPDENTVQISNATIKTVPLNVGVTSTLIIGGTITNNGSINMSTGDGPSQMLVGSASVTLTGAGTTTLDGTLGNTDSIDGPGGTLNLGSQQLIHGSGVIGLTSLAVNNAGTIQADFNAQTLTLSPTGGNLNNTGLLTAKSSATLAIVNNSSSGTFLSTGTILAQSTGSISFSGAGTIDTGSGTVIVQSGGTLINSTTIIATSITADGQFTNLFRMTAPMIGGTVIAGAGSYTSGDATHPFANSFLTSVRVGTLSANNGTATILSGGGSLGTSRVSRLNIAAAGHLDISDHDFIVDYALGGGTGSPINSIATFVANGYANQAWNGAGGIDSFIAAAIDANPGILHKVGLGYADASNIGSPATFGGQTIDNTTTLIRYTYVGDANLDLRVNMLDFNALATNFGTGGGGGANRLWFQGDFNYDGKVNTLDFNALATNFNFALASPALGTLVPEPTWGVVAIVILAAGRRRRTDEQD